MTVRIPSAPSDVSRVRQILTQQVSSLIHTRSGPTGQSPSGPVRIRVPLPEVSLLSWLHAQPAERKIYWAGREDAWRVAGVGTADILEGSGPDPYRTVIRTLHRRLSEADPALRYFGGFRFRPTSTGSDRWRRYGTYRFLLPRFELRNEDGGTVLLMNLLPEETAGAAGPLLEEIERLRFPSTESSASVPEARALDHRPERSEWTEGVETLLEAIADTDLEKAVLARESRITFTRTPDPSVVLRRLRSRTPRCFHFLFQPEEGSAFLGASPERLFRRSDRSIQSEAVAGTRARGRTSEQDERLREELLASAKDRAEHYYVQRHLDRAATRLCERYELEDDPMVMSLATKHHLLSHLSGHLRPDTDDGHLLETLHPTPAVAGFPTEAALARIGEVEPFDRGWYAGPVGWLGPEEAEFAVAIRSALLHDERLFLYAGAGIVEQSVASEEWTELDQKIEDFTAFLTPSA